MKLRIRGNSIRLRLGRGEIATLIERGAFEEAIQFAPGQLLRYGVRISDDVSQPAASFDDGRIEVMLPARLANQWASGSDVGISAEQPLDSGSLRILIEKDFTCLNPMAGEDQSDAFPHPDAASGCASSDFSS